MVDAEQPKSEGQDVILLADRASPWREAVSERLRSEGHPPQLSSDGEELHRVLSSSSTEPKVVVIGSELEKEGGLEALYQAHQELKKGKKGKFDRSILLLCEARSDIELLDLFRRRGVVDFLYREDPVENTVTRLLNSVFAKRRSAPRNAVRLSAVVTVGASEVPAVIEDLSAGGARVVIAQKEFHSSFSTGQTVGLSFEVQQVQVSCSAEIRRLSIRKVLFSERVVIGLQFIQLDQVTSEAIKQMVDWASQQFVVSDYLSIKPF